MMIRMITVLALFAASASLYAAQIGFFIGDVDIIRSGKKIKASSDIELQSGDIIKTGKDSAVDIMYKDGSKVTIKSNSTTTIGNAGIKGSDNVSISSGDLVAKFGKLSKGNKRKIYSPTAVASVRGTEFGVSVNKFGETQVDLKEGRLNLNNPYGEKDMASGEKSEAGLAEAPREAGELSGQKWKDERSKAYEERPSDAVNKYEDYISKLSYRNGSSEKDSKDIKGRIGEKKSKKYIEETGSKLAAAEERIEDDIMQSQAAYMTIDDVIQDYKTRKNNIYSEFERIKSELNKVQEVQRMNYEAIQGVKDSYIKAYQEISDRFKKDMQELKEGLKSDKVKPEIKKY